MYDSRCASNHFEVLSDRYIRLYNPPIILVLPGWFTSLKALFFTILFTVLTENTAETEGGEVR
ncbi:hypothetical protein M378DRAFT_163301 [Amanita muscaria Koide BX008]|uniref:Uncharacterized protein n=1 Tax=Amanita muscaria (strain Koide BX008) TaxID=946122 RepID=A0A0C2TCI9_AMAMK|nr:hypothetical protein M378DRAFT_163301 [Amanita muscaria Koide BX008]